MKVRFNRYVYINKEENFDLEEQFNDPDLLYCGYEEELIYEYDTETKYCVLVGAGGFFLSEKKVTPGELTRIREIE